MTKDYQDYLKSPEWGEKRKLKLEEAGYLCQLCGTKYHPQRSELLCCHHSHYDNFKEEKLTDLIILCRRCHDVAHVVRGVRKDEYRIEDNNVRYRKLQDGLTGDAWASIMQEAGKFIEERYGSTNGSFDVKSRFVEAQEMDQKGLMPVKEMAHIMGVSKETARRMISDGRVKGKSVQHGKLSYWYAEKKSVANYSGKKPKKNGKAAPGPFLKTVLERWFG